MKYDDAPIDIRPPLTSGEVAKLLDVSRERVVQLDDELRPARTARGLRVYDRRVVDDFAAARRARRLDGRR